MTRSRRAPFWELLLYGLLMPNGLMGGRWPWMMEMHSYYFSRRKLHPQLRHELR